MAKRISLSDRRADDVKGIDTIFGDSPSQIASKEQSQARAEKPAMLEEEIGQALKSPKPSGRQDSGQSSIETTSNDKTVSKKPDLAKVTIYIRHDQVFAVEAIQLAERQKTGTKPDKSDLMQEALDLLVAKYR